MHIINFRAIKAVLLKCVIAQMKASLLMDARHARSNHCSFTLWSCVGSTFFCCHIVTAFWNYSVYSEIYQKYVTWILILQGPRYKSLLVFQIKL